MCDIAALRSGSSVSLISCKILRKGTPRTLRSASLDELQCAMKDPLRYIAYQFWPRFEGDTPEHSEVGQRILDALYAELATRVSSEPDNGG